MQIEVIKADVESKGKYKQVTVSYKQDGKVQSRFLVSFGDYKHVYDKMVEATQGDLFDIELKKVAGKDGVERWQWVNATVTGKAGVGTNKPSAGVSTSPRSSFETPEERAKRQVYIVRQSSISNAIDFLKGGKNLQTDDILACARIFEAFVFENREVSTPKDYVVEIM